MPSDQLGVLITGASSGVGRAVAVAFAREGRRIALVGRRRKELEVVAEQIRGCGGVALTFVADLSLRAEINKLASDVRMRFGPFAVLVHSAGVHAEGAVSETSEEDFDRTFDTNLRAPYFLTQQLLTQLRPPAYVVFMNSSVVGQRRAGVALYAASKSGLAAFADSLRQEVNAAGVRVLTVYLGATASPMQERIYASANRPYNPAALVQPADVASAIQAVVALPPNVEVTDLHIRPSLPHR